MADYDVQSIDLNVPGPRAFGYIADAARLPLWTRAFASVDDGKAVLRTPEGEVEIELAVAAADAAGTVDWHMTFPDGSVAVAYSRVTALGPGRCVYSFVLTPPPVPLEQLEGALEAQSKTLAEELATLKGILEAGG